MSLYTGIVLAAVMVMSVQSLDRQRRAQCGGVVYWTLKIPMYQSSTKTSSNGPYAC